MSEYSEKVARALEGLEGSNDEPAPEDYTISPCGSLGSRFSVGVVEGRHIGEFNTREEAETAIRKHAGEFRPDVWIVSDHGNTSLADFQWDVKL